MTRRAGHTLVELTASMCAGAIIIGAAVAIALRADGDRALIGGLTDDAVLLRRAVTAVETDLRRADAVTITDGGLCAGGAAWRVDAGALLRDEVVVARRVAAFEAARDPDGCIRVRIQLRPRVAGSERRAEVATCVRPRVQSQTDGAVR